MRHCKRKKGWNAEPFFSCPGTFWQLSSLVTPESHNFYLSALLNRNSHLLGAHPMIIILFECDLSRNKSSPSSLISLHNMYVLYMYMYVCTSCASWRGSLMDLLVFLLYINSHLYLYMYIHIHICMWSKDFLVRFGTPFSTHAPLPPWMLSSMQWG